MQYNSNQFWLAKLTLFSGMPKCSDKAMRISLQLDSCNTQMIYANCVQKMSPPEPPGGLVFTDNH